MLVHYTLTNHKQTCYQSSQLALGYVCFPALGTGCMRFFLFVNAQGDYFDSQNKTTFTKIIRTCENLAPAELINWQIYRLTNHLGTGLTLTTKQRKYTPIITYNMN